MVSRRLQPERCSPNASLVWSTPSISYNKPEPPLYACLRNILNALEHRGVLLRQQRLLRLADCSSRDFSAHIAHVSLAMIRYNILASTKKTFDYDTIGGLFGNMYLRVHELTVVEKIWCP